jgi:hypothetical protein
MAGKDEGKRNSFPSLSQIQKGLLAEQPEALVNQKNGCGGQI